MAEVNNDRLLDAEQPPSYSERPPTYSEAMKGGTASVCETAHDPTEQPPTYASLFGDIQEARRQSTSVAGFLKNFLVLLLGTIGCTICAGLILAIPVSMIVIGSYHLHDCKAEKMIPIYLIVLGVVGLVKNLLNLGKKMKAHLTGDDDATRESTRESSLDNLITLFIVIWFIAGNVWIYRVYMPTDEECNTHLYLFAFWLTTSTYIVVCLLVSCILCAAVCALGSTEPNNISNA